MRLVTRISSDIVIHVEFYLDVIQRLKLVIIELERQRALVVVVAHQAVLRALYASFAYRPLKEIPYIEFSGCWKLLSRKPTRKCWIYVTSILFGWLLGLGYANKNSPASGICSKYAQNGLPKVAVDMFLAMLQRSVRPDEHIMVSVISACSKLGDLELAQWVDSYMNSGSFNFRNEHVEETIRA